MNTRKCWCWFSFCCNCGFPSDTFDPRENSDEFEEKDPRSHNPLPQEGHDEDSTHLHSVDLRPLSARCAHVEDGFQHARDVHINLSVVTATMAGITIGVGIDYAIHYSTLFRYHEKMKSDEPHVRAFEDTSKPIIANILGLALGLTVMNLSPLMIHTYLSLIMWTTMLASSSLSLTILPYLLSKISSSKNR